ncbi:MAG: ATP-grasp domain-containing protein [Bdellovibrionales bacterium]|nr:ATP-grasp domain-containing protein [Bdellovibrionales bacterium]
MSKQQAPKPALRKAEWTVSAPKKTWVMGRTTGQSFSDRIAAELNRAGFGAEVLPTTEPNEPGAIEALRKNLQELKLKGFDGVHPGNSRWGVHPEWIVACQEAGFQTWSPSVRTLTLFQHSLTLLHRAERVGVANLALSFDLIHGRRELDRILARVKLPIVLKSSRPREGLSFLVLSDPKDLDREFPLWLERLRIRLGEAIAFVERYVEGARMIRMIFVRDRNGRCWVMPPMDRTLQSRGFPLVEVFPAPNVDPKVEKRMVEWTMELADKAHFVGLGTFEFMLDSHKVYLISGHPGLQEDGFFLGSEILDLQAQALWSELPDSTEFQKWKKKRLDPQAMAHVLAEDSVLQLPRPGKITHFLLSKITDETQTLSEYRSGQSVPSHSSPAVGTIWCRGETHEQALLRLQAELAASEISGSLQTNLNFLNQLVAHPWVREGMVHAGFLDEEFIPQTLPDAQEQNAFYWIGRKLFKDPTVKIRLGHRTLQEPAQAMEVRMDSAQEGFVLGAKFRASPIQPDLWQVQWKSWSLTLRAVSPRRAQDPLQMRSTTQGIVKSIFFQEGAALPAHEQGCLIEVQGTLIGQAVARTVRLKKWLVSTGDFVEFGQPLALLEDP